MRIGLLWIMCFCLLSPVLAKSDKDIAGVRVWPSPDSTRVVFDMTLPPDYTYFTLRSPDRLVIDFNDTQSAVSFKNLVKDDNRITKIRTSKPKNANSTRIVLELASAYKFNIFPLAPAGHYGDRLVVDILDKSLAAEPVKPTHDDKKNIVIAIVAGHGGDDPGSIGPSGHYEKNITLQIAKQLARVIDKQPGFQAVLVRKGDYYVDHDKKTEIARTNKADFLISIHADAFTTPKPSGASVWVQLPRRANSELSKWMDQRQKNSELLGGVGKIIKQTDDDNLAITLADMQKEHSLATSIEMAEMVLGELKKVTKLHKSSPQHMSLAVLKSSDIPSILIETGFISNPQEERQLLSRSHQLKLATAIKKATVNYFKANPPEGTLIASTSERLHKVSRGESLSVLAARYQVSVQAIKAANNMASDSVLIGQTLKIPRAN